MSLRHGFTTGTAAAAAAKAATTHLLTGQAVQHVNVPLPVGGRVILPILESTRLGETVMAAVVKDAGDDPDVTDKAIIRAKVRPAPGADIILRGGSGVGVVTKPGLPVAVGEAAINPTPRIQIRQAVEEALKDASGGQGFPPLHPNQGGESANTSEPAPGFRTPKMNFGLDVEISVDNGAELAKKTFNPRLGIVGGISILGTRGTVKPFSHAAYQATIGQCLDVMQASGLSCPNMTTGGRSERFLRQNRKQIDESACVQVADFFSFAMHAAGLRGFTAVRWGVFFGKLVKQALGHASTHAHKSPLDLGTLAMWSAHCAFPSMLCEQVAKANTALEALELLTPHPQSQTLFALLTRKAAGHARHFSGRDMAVDYLLFNFDGQILYSTEDA